MAKDIVYNNITKMLFINCAVKEKPPIETLIDPGANADLTKIY